MKILLTLSTLLLFLLSACSGAVRSALNQADTLMEEHPDSALSILQAIDRSRIPERNLPYYALLMTQAMVKTGVPLDSDTLIYIAYGKYADDWWGDKGIRSNFYMGEIFYNQEKNREAMHHYLSAYEEAKRLGNDYWHAKSAERIADLFFNAYNYPEAARYRKEAIEYFGKSARITNQRYAVVDLVFDYINDSRYDEAIVMLDSIYDKSIMDNPIDSLLLQYILSPRIDILIATNRINEIDSVDYRLLDIMQGNPSNIETFILRNQIKSNADSSSFTSWIDNLNQADVSIEDKARMLFSQYESVKMSGNSSLDFDLVDSLLHYQNSVAENIIMESVTGAERDFYSEMTLRNEKKSQIFFICFLAACIAAILIWRIYKLKSIASRIELESTIESFVELEAKSTRDAFEKSVLKEEIKKNERSIEELKAAVIEKSLKVELLEHKMTETITIKTNLENDIKLKNDIMDRFRHSLDEKTLVLDTLRQEISQLHNEINEQRQNIKVLENSIEIQSNDLRNKDIVLETLFKDKWTTLNLLCNEYYEKGDSPIMRKHITDSIEKELKKIGSRKGIALIEVAVDSHFDGIINRLRTECTNLTEKDITLAVLIIAGFSGKAISYLMGIKTGNFYVSKRRLIDRISSSNSPSSERILALLG